jgi:hypothetical protein
VIEAGLCAAWGLLEAASTVLQTQYSREQYVNRQSVPS